MLIYRVEHMGINLEVNRLLIKLMINKENSVIKDMQRTVLKVT